MSSLHIYGRHASHCANFVYLAKYMFFIFWMQKSAIHSKALANIRLRIYVRNFHWVAASSSTAHTVNGRLACPTLSIFTIPYNDQGLTDASMDVKRRVFWIREIYRRGIHIGRWWPCQACPFCLPSTRLSWSTFYCAFYRPTSICCQVDIKWNHAMPSLY